MQMSLLINNSCALFPKAQQVRGALVRGVNVGRGLVSFWNTNILPLIETKSLDTDFDKEINICPRKMFGLHLSWTLDGFGLLNIYIQTFIHIRVGYMISTQIFHI